ncbi:MAG: ComF family protein [Elusimicrobia bacterium]|nr:ComF family protein [Elusimicrobiota bacterium]
MGKWSSSFRVALDFFFPSFCAGCEVYLGFRADPRRLCPSCEVKLEAARQEHVSRRSGGGSLDAFFSFGPYGSEPLTTLIHKIKYQQKDWIFEALEPALRRHLCGFNLESMVDAVAPVPLHSWRLRERGFNQAEIIGQAVAEHIGKPLEKGLMRRSRRTKPQMSLTDKSLRRANVRGAFEALQPGSAQGKSFLLVDDVSTTGATLHEAAAALRQAGARKVIGFALAA